MSDAPTTDAMPAKGENFRALGAVAAEPFPPRFVEAADLGIRISRALTEIGAKGLTHDLKQAIEFAHAREEFVRSQGTSRNPEKNRRRALALSIIVKEMGI